MKSDIRRWIQELDRLTVRQLRGRYGELFGEPSRSGNRQHLVRRIVWRMQAAAEGGLSTRALRRAEELADEHGLRLSSPRDGDAASPEEEPTPQLRGTRSRRPSPGTVLVRNYKGRVVQVTVLEDAFLCDGQEYGSLSAVARAVTGSRWSGHVFFGLAPRKRRG